MEDDLGLKPLVAATLRFLRITAVASLWEARCAWLLEPCLWNLIYATEGAQYDCGLLITDSTSKTLMVKADVPKLNRLMGLFEKEDILVPLDFKTISPIPFTKYRGNRYFYSFSVKRQQRLCTTYIVGNPAVPHLVTIIPQYYLMRDNNETKYGGYRIYADEDFYSGHQVEH